MEKKNTLTRWILKPNKSGTVDIINREVSRFAPLNRILVDVGFYELEFFQINEDKYFYTFESSEKGLNKSIVHVGKRKDGQLLDMDDDDFKNLPEMRNLFFGKKVVMMN